MQAPDASRTPIVRTPVNSITSHPRRLVAIIAVVILAALAVGAFLLWNNAQKSTAANEGGALAEFRAKGVADTTPPPGVPAAGVYRYQVTGSEIAGSGVLSAQRSLPPEAVYVITPIEGGYHEDLRLSEEHVEEARFRVDGEGTFATWRRNKVTFLGIGEDDRTPVEPPSLDHPATLKVGATWSGAYAMGDIQTEYTGTVTGKRTLQVDGAKVPVYVIQTKSAFTGSTPGTRTDTISWSPDLSLPVAWTITQKTGGSADYKIDAAMKLASGTPLT
jgi:hypothetical protein